MLLTANINQCSGFYDLPDREAAVANDKRKSLLTITSRILDAGMDRMQPRLSLSNTTLTNFSGLNTLDILVSDSFVTSVHFLKESEHPYAFQEEIIKYRVNSKAANRLNKFFGLVGGWDGPDSKAVSVKSLNSLVAFVSTYDVTREDVCIFMSSEGNLILNWPTPGGELVEFTFMPDVIHIYFDANDHEVDYQYDDLDRLSMLMKEVA